MNARTMAFKLTYSTMFDPPEELHTRFEAALAEAPARPRGGPAPPPGGGGGRGRGRPAAEAGGGARAGGGSGGACGAGRFPPLAERGRLARRAAALIEERVYVRA